MDDNGPSLGRLLRRDLAIAVVGLVVAALGINGVVRLSHDRTTYRACSPSGDRCVERHQSLHVPGFRRTDTIWIGHGPCGVEYRTPFGFVRRPLWRSGSVELFGPNNTRALYITTGDC